MKRWAGDVKGGERELIETTSSRHMGPKKAKISKTHRYKYRQYKLRAE